MRFLYAVIGILLLLPAPVQAGYIGVPLPLENEDLFLVNAMADFWNRTNRDDTGLQEYNFDVYGVRGEANFTSHINIVGELGVSNFNIENSNISMNENIFWGVGAKFRIFDLEKYQFAFGAGFHTRWLDNENETTGIHLDYREYEAYLGATFYRFNFMDPYLGILFSTASGDIQKDDEYDYNVEEDKVTGIFAGFQYRLTSHLDLGFEFRGFSVTGTTFFINYYWRE